MLFCFPDGAFVSSHTSVKWYWNQISIVRYVMHVVVYTYIYCDRQCQEIWYCYFLLISSTQNALVFKIIICFNIKIYNFLQLTDDFSGLVYEYKLIALMYCIYYELNFVIISWHYQWCNGLPNSSSLFLTHADDRISRGCSLN